MIICLACCRTILSQEEKRNGEKAEPEPYQALETPCCRAAICDQCVEVRLATFPF